MQPAASSQQSRDNRLDIIRFIGLTMIILAHAHPPDLIFQLRNFDVPLMVIVSGISFGLSYKINQSYISYLWKRFKRLVLPVWLFLSCYFSFLFFSNPEHSDLTLRTIFLSYALISGIGYVWIIRIFLLVAIASPLIFNYHKKIDSNVKYLLSIFIIFLAYEMLRYLTMPYIQDGFGKVIHLVTHYIAPYSILFALGLRFSTLPSHLLKCVCFFNLALFIAIGLTLFYYYGNIIPTQEFKYPASLYYFSYAISVTVALWMLAPKIERLLAKTKMLSFVLFVGKNSIWIYLWHIPFTQNIQYHYFLKFFVVFSIAVSLTFIQVYLVRKVLIGQVGSVRFRKNINALLTG